MRPKQLESNLNSYNKEQEQQLNKIQIIISYLKFTLTDDYLNPR